MRSLMEYYVSEWNFGPADLESKDNILKKVYNFPITTVIVYVSSCNKLSILSKINEFHEFLFCFKTV